jgi:predicted nucleotidyltransferase
MALDIETVQKIAKDYITEVRKIMHIDKVYLYGSYAKGTYDDASDVDICFFSNQFENRRTVDILTELLMPTLKFPQVYIEPKAFPTSEINNDNPFVKEVLRTGYEL